MLSVIKQSFAKPNVMAFKCLLYSGMDPKSRNSNYCCVAIILNVIKMWYYLILRLDLR
jgi:hypothetical protein